MTDTRNRRAPARLLAALALGMAAAAAPAQSIDVTGAQRVGAETRSVQVRYGDLALDRTADRAQLDRRIRQATRQVCGSAPRKGLDARNDHMACSTMAVADAESQLRAAVPTMVAGGGG